MFMKNIATYTANQCCYSNDETLWNFSRKAVVSSISSSSLRARQKTGVCFFCKCLEFGRFLFESAELFEIKHPRGLSRVKADAGFCWRDKQAGWGENRGDNKRRNRGRSSSLFSKAFFSYRQCTPNPKKMKTVNVFSGTGA